MTPYHYTHNNPVNRIDPDGKQDYSSLLRSRNYVMNFDDVIANKVYNHLDRNGVSYLENTSTVLTYAGSVPTPASPFLLGSATILQAEATTIKIKKNGISQDVIGDIAGGAAIELTKKKFPVIGPTVNTAVDNFKTTNQKVDPKYNIHSGPANVSLSGGTQQSEESEQSQNSENDLNPIPAHETKSKYTDTMRDLLGITD